MPVRRYLRRGGVALAALVAAFALLGGCDGAASHHAEATGTPDAADPVRRATPAVRTNLDCQPTSTPVSSTPGGGPRIVDATALDCAVAPGGAPARFQVTVANPTGKAYERAGLTFSYGYSAWGDDPNALRIEYHHGGTWTRLPMHWINPDEPELLESGAMHVDLPPRSTKTYDVRFALPVGYVPEAGVVSFGGGVILDLPDETRQRHASSVRGPVFALDPPRGTPVNLNVPRAALPGGGPVEFAAEVDNPTGRAYDRSALDLRIDGVADDRTTLEMFRDGGWHPMTLRTSADHVVGTIADGLSVPAGYRHIYRLRVRLLPGAIRTGGANPRMSLRLRDLAARDADLGTAERLLHVVLPTVHVQLPKEIRAPGAVEFPLSIENATGVGLPSVKVRLTITNPPTRDGLTVAYRPAGRSAPWTPLPLSAGAEGTRAWTAELPPPRPDGTPAGLRASYDVRIELAKWNAETGNLLHVAAVLVLDDGSPVSASTEGDPANAYIGVRSD
ncbi:hypothetical protein [Actinopolymorpha pittospori]